MVTENIKYPFLEIVKPTECELIIQAIFENIQHVPLCWLAEEELESQYSGVRINDELYFKRNKYRIEFRQKGTNRILAKIQYDGNSNGYLN